MTELEQAEEALTQVTARTQELASMGSLELHAAVAAGPSQARVLLDYHQRLRQLNRVRTATWMWVRELRAAQGLSSLGIYTEIPPDFGPMPRPAPGSNVITGRESTWVHLLAALNGDDVAEITRCLRDLEGWIFQPESASGSQPG